MLNGARFIESPNEQYIYISLTSLPGREVDESWWAEGERRPTTASVSNPVDR